jgi:23S rRNA (guanine2445-N2)-methyltransferase / 23S rRNA (guanine2069-N7)-methyltransferase
MGALLELFATCPRGMEDLLAVELKELGGAEVRRARGGVSLRGDLAVAYGAALWARTASRILLRLAAFPSADADELYAGIAAIEWEEHIGPDATIAVDFPVTGPGITDTRFGAMRVKDAIVDRLREKRGSRPDVDTRDPDVRINVALVGARAVVAVDLSGPPLHRRGWREPGVQAAAPLKENLAAAVLLAAGWPALAEQGAAFHDPMCGSGTLVIEAALIAADIAPGLARESWGFQRWAGHDASVWAAVRGAAVERARARRERAIGPLSGADIDAKVVGIATDNARRAGVADLIRWQTAPLGAAAVPVPAIADLVMPGLVAVNPPYGERLADRAGSDALYARLGDDLSARFEGWRAAILAPDEGTLALAHLVGPHIRPLHNGPLEIVLGTAKVREAGARAPIRKRVLGRDIGAAVEQFANRLRRDEKHLGKWARRAGIEAFRVYDADLPDFALAVDRYGEHLVVAEYEPPREIEPELAEARFESALAVIPEVLEVAPANVHVKRRRRQRGAEQYEKLEPGVSVTTVHEAGLAFEVDLDGYLDTGLFLDHRVTRAWIGRLAEGRRFCNLFGYTGAATVHAAAGGATETLTVDLSATYLSWALRNLGINNLAGPQHTRERHDVTAWLAEGAPAGAFDLVFLDPPTFSTSKSMEGTLDVQRDHVALVRGSMRMLAPDGWLVFSTNARRFRIAAEELADLTVVDVTARTIPKDFERSPRIHAAFLIGPAGSDPREALALLRP